MSHIVETPIKANIVVIDDLVENLHILMALLTESGYEVRGFPDGEFGLQSIRANLPDLILLDVKMPGMNGYQICEQLKAGETTRDIPVIFLSALTEIEDKVTGFEAGGVDYITKPFRTAEVLARVKLHLLLRRLQEHLEDAVEARTEELRQANARLRQEIDDRQRIETELQQAFVEIQRLQDRLQAENTYLRQEIQLVYNFDDIIGQSPPLKYLLYRVEKVAATDTTVLITGETGVGKELIARAIHHYSRRKDRPLIKVNCAALPAHLIESELFGHEKGAFTGAAGMRSGRFELADGATLFLDEIGELPLELQPKLLRVLQEGAFERLGSSQTRTVDVRVIAATNRDLDTEARAGRFREDLYYRLNVYPLSVMPLRERPEDIPLLAQAFAQKLSKKLGKPLPKIPHSTLTRLQAYAWPGNVRELENVIARALIIADDDVLRVELPEPQPALRETLHTLAEVERAYIIRVLELKNWRVSGPNGAAVVLGLNPFTLRSRMAKLGIAKPV